MIVAICSGYPGLNFDFTEFDRFFKRLGKFKDINFSCFIPTKANDINKADLVVFTGGEDISPELYGEDNYASSNYPERDAWDLYWLTIARNLNKKIFGVCRGSQFLNGVLGAKLYQDIQPSHFPKHIIRSSGRFNFPDYLLVNSHHHQGVRWNDDNYLIPVAYYDDVVEVSMSSNKSIFAVQFHPEYDTFPEESRVIFYRYFIEEFLNAR